MFFFTLPCYRRTLLNDQDQLEDRLLGNIGMRPRDASIFIEELQNHVGGGDGLALSNWVRYFFFVLVLFSCSCVSHVMLTYNGSGSH